MRHFDLLHEMVRARPYCFTLNNWTHDEDILLREFGESELCRYMVFQQEIGDEGTPHLQGFVELEKPKTLSSLKTHLGIERIHLELARNRVASREYCKKSETRVDGTEPFECGVWKDKGQGKRSDLELVVEDIGDGASLTEIAESHPIQFIKYFNGISKLMAQISGERDWKTEVIVYYGETGTGKTRKAFEENPHCYWKPQDYNSQSWFDTYAGEHTVVIDEFYGWIPFSTMLRLCDRYPMLVPVKGSMVQFVAKKIIITSNQHPSEWYSKMTVARLKPLMRRIDKCFYFTKDNVVEEQLYFE